MSRGFEGFRRSRHLPAARAFALHDIAIVS
jgi:hypothetical protein